MSYPHIPVLLNEILESFSASQIKIFLDGTLGAGGHAQALLEAHPEIELYIGIDQDPSALKIAEERLKRWNKKLHLRQMNFSQFDILLKELNVGKLDGILVDLGVSSMQLDQAERGFSFSQEGPLDMRMNPSGALSAEEIINGWSEKELGRIFRDYGEEKQWRKAAQAVVSARSKKRISTTTDLADVLNEVLYRNYKKGINPLTLIFQALRICTNSELQQLEDFLSKAFDCIGPKGRLAVISFHSLEDRIVKQHIRFQAQDKWDTIGLGGGIFKDKDPNVINVTRKPVIPRQEEILKNPRSRSAKLRIAEKI